MQITEIRQAWKSSETACKIGVEWNPIRERKEKTDEKKR
jgi:hypothetical protein